MLEFMMFRRSPIRDMAYNIARAISTTVKFVEQGKRYDVIMVRVQGIFVSNPLNNY